MMKNSLSKLALSILALPRFAKRSVALAIDLNLIVLTVFLAYYLRLGEFVVPTSLIPVVLSIGIAIPIFDVTGLYRAVFRHSGLSAFFAIVRAIGVYGLIYATIFTVIGVSGVPRTIGIIQPILLLLFIGASRILARVLLGDYFHNIFNRSSRPKVLIYGAGATGRQLVRAMSHSNDMQVVGFLDDDDTFYGRLLNGQPVYKPADLKNLIHSVGISDVLLAMPNLSRKKRNEILINMQKTRVAVRTIPNVTDIVSGKVSISDLKELDIEDLLGREPVLPNEILFSMNIRSKVVMVTGAGGSIGSELCRQILSVSPSKLLLIDQNEFSLYSIHQELEERFGSCDVVLVPLLASVQNGDRMHKIISTWRPDTIYHAAAYKHVPLVEYNHAEGIKNNVSGTLQIAQIAAENGVSNFVLVSTDKAVRPTNIMGASKRLAEMVLQALAVKTPSTKFSIVRFGNVLGSSGSVVPKFRKQISDGGPITLTHPDIVRYFMTIPEASQLVIQAGAMANGGDVFVLDMGQPVKIIDLARRMVELSGFTIKDEENPDGEIEIEITGLRPGEKLFEELLIGNNPRPTSHSMIMKAEEEFFPWAELEVNLKLMDIALKVNDVDLIRLIMQKLVTGYTPSDEIVDLVYLEQVSV